MWTRMATVLAMLVMMRGVIGVEERAGEDEKEWTVWPYGNTGGGWCTTLDDCGGWGQGATCHENKCFCIVPYTCPHCSQECEYPSHGQSWPTCLNDCSKESVENPSDDDDEDEYADPSTWEVEGGGRCSTGADCYDWIGGSCIGGRCVCFDGWFCTHCTKAKKDIDAGVETCPRPAKMNGGQGSAVMGQTLVVAILACACTLTIVGIHLL